MIIEYSSSNSSSRKAQLARMKNLKLQTWEEHFAKVDDFISNLKDLPPN